jgi:histidine phosphotransferase ChpT
MELDARVVDLLLSRLFHDLIGPASATSNGIELLEEFGPRGNDPIAVEALDLIGASARQSADRLSYFRLAFGGAGNSDEHSVATTRQVAEAYFSSRKIPLEFTAAVDGTSQPRAGIIKALLASLLLMADSLPRQGRVTVEIGYDLRVAVSAVGAGAEIEPGSIASLSAADWTDGLNTRTVIGAVVGHTARRFDLDLEVENEPDTPRLTFRTRNN